MPVCLKCDREVCHPCFPDLDGIGDDFIKVAWDEELLNPVYVRRLAIATANLGISRREIPNWIADVVFNCERAIIWPYVAEFRVTDTMIDDAFGNDGSFRWLSDFVKYQYKPLAQRPQRRVLDRLRLIDLAFKIARPDVARHFSR